MLSTNYKLKLLSIVMWYGYISNVYLCSATLFYKIQSKRIFFLKKNLLWYIFHYVNIFIIKTMKTNLFQKTGTIFEAKLQWWGQFLWNDLPLISETHQLATWTPSKTSSQTCMMPSIKHLDDGVLHTRDGMGSVVSQFFLVDPSSFGTCFWQLLT